MPVCAECHQPTQQAVLLKASTWYYIFDHDSSEWKMQEGWGYPRLHTRELWELIRAKRDVYSPVYGKIFNCFIPYCRTCLPGNPKR